MKSKFKHWISYFKSERIREMKKQIRWVYAYAKSNVFFIVIYTLLGLSGTVISLISSLVSRDLVDIITGHRTGELLTTFCCMLGITLGSTMVSQLSSYVSRRINLKIDNEIKADVFEKIMETEWESLSRYHSGDLVARWNGDASVISNGILSLIPNAIIYSFRFVSALVMVCKYDASFAIFAIAGIPISMLISRESIKRMQKQNMSSITTSTKLSSFNQESFGNIQTLKAFDMLPVYQKRLKELQEEYTKVSMKYQKVTIINSLILTVVSMLVTYSAQGWGIYKVWTGAISYGTMTMFLSLSSTLSGTVNSLLSLFPSSIALANSAGRLMSIIDLPKEDYSMKQEVKEFYLKNADKGIGICIRSVAYGYGEAEDVFTNADIDARPREVVAFVGPSGEGKTTMLRYILSIVNARAGEGYIFAGSDFEKSQSFPITASVRQLMAYVPQGNTMFSGSIASNMRNVKEDASDEEIIEALKLACAWDFVEKLPEQINSSIMERGGGFSEGQAQRLSIARALLRKSPILLLDEATSALDIETERKVLKNIMSDDYPRTVIVTTHRPTVLKNCTRVYAIKEKSCTLLGQPDIDKLINDF